MLIKVAAAGVNRPDVMQREGLYPPPKGATDIPGLEIAGEIVALGAGVDVEVGDHVGAGARRRLCRIVRRRTASRPAGARGSTMVEAAALPETFFTVWITSSTAAT